LDKAYTPCHEFLEVFSQCFPQMYYSFPQIQVRKLDVVNMVLRDINLSARLYTNETYESYLRRRIAQILSQYCENVPEVCGDGNVWEMDYLFRTVLVLWLKSGASERWSQHSTWMRRQ
jgi:hypothetical protein